MKKFQTRQFTSSEGVDEWLNSFEEARNGRPRADYDFAVIGYVSVGNLAIITVEYYEN